MTLSKLDLFVLFATIQAIFFIVFLTEILLILLELTVGFSVMCTCPLRRGSPASFVSPPFAKRPPIFWNIANIINITNRKFHVLEKTPYRYHIVNEICRREHTWYINKRLVANYLLVISNITYQSCRSPHDSPHSNCIPSVVYMPSSTYKITIPV